MRKFNFKEYLANPSKVVNSLGQIVEINRRIGVLSGSEALVCRTYTSDGNYTIGLYNFDGEPVFNGVKLDAPCLYFKPIEKVGYINLYLSEPKKGTMIVTAGCIYDTEDEAKESIGKDKRVYSYLQTVSIIYTV